MICIHEVIYSVCSRNFCGILSASEDFMTHDEIMVLDNTCSNKPTEMWVSKRDLTNDEELPGATLGKA